MDLQPTELRERALLFLGGMRAADRISAALSAQVMANLIAFEKERMHESCGSRALPNSSTVRRIRR